MSTHTLTHEDQAKGNMVMRERERLLRECANAMRERGLLHKQIAYGLGIGISTARRYTRKSDGS